MFIFYCFFRIVYTYVYIYIHVIVYINIYIFADSCSGFHLLINRYTFGKDHGISFHTDDKQGYDVNKDPITSFSSRLGSLLLIIDQNKSTNQEKTSGKHALAVYQPPGSILVMGGRFQHRYFHGVPSFAEMKLCAYSTNGIVKIEQRVLKLEWWNNSKLLLQQEIERIDTQNLKDVQNARWNMTMRWIRNHLHPLCTWCKSRPLHQLNQLRREQMKIDTFSKRVLQKEKLAWNPPEARADVSGSGATSSLNLKRETEKTEAEKEEVSQYASMLYDALTLQILSDDQLIHMALCGGQDVRRNRLESLEDQYKLAEKLYRTISTSKMKDTEHFELLLKTIDSKLRRMKRLQMLIELLWLQSPKHGNFMTCNILKDNSSNRSNDHLQKMTLSFDDLGKCLDEEKFLNWDLMKEHGWLVFNFDALPEMERPQVMVEVSRSQRKKEQTIYCDVSMGDEIRVHQFDILYIGRKSVNDELYPLRVTFLTEATKTVVAKFPEDQELTSKRQFKLWMQGLMTFVADLEAEKGFSAPYNDRKEYMKSCSIVLWFLRTEDQRTFLNKKQKQDPV